MTIKSKYDSVCPICGSKIHKGDLVEWKKGEKAVHLECSKKNIEVNSETITEEEKLLLEGFRRKGWSPSLVNRMLLKLNKMLEEDWRENDKHEMFDERKGTPYTDDLNFLTSQGDKFREIIRRKQEEEENF